MSESDNHDLSLYDNLGFLLGKVSQIKDRLLDQYIANEDITATQMKMLYHLYFVNTNRPSEIGTYLYIDNSAITRMLDRLEKKELIKRIPDPNDRRSILVELTQKGKDVTKRTIPFAIHAIDDLTQCLTSDETQQLQSCLKKIVEHLMPEEFRLRYTKESE
ncbi:MarR family winged helix-turn-helix transcriptional regulator [Vibrio salinus]|uniref:MarR family winged helix-turn-helix transcriptional regulator n=1 Tax=Vibrio salinus TaxID=2899784 RepID=UPI001E3D4B81|nr:MarR family transcriptional regulator [Vibrio salinus]MCE0495897.1 MarR family transcriptional regulator [Vibrio salinus]